MEQYPFTPVGIIPDAVPEAAPADFWTLGSNVYARDGMERAGGIEPAFGSPIYAPRWLLNTRSIAAPSYWIYGADDGIGGTDGGAHDDLTPAGFVPNPDANCWSGGNLNGVPVIGNGAQPLWWDGVNANPFTVLPGWPASARCKAIRPYQFHLIAMNVDPSIGTFNPDLVWWSSAAVPGTVPATWTPAANNEAGSAQLSQSAGAILDGAQLRGAFIIYKSTSAYIMQYVGGAQVFTVQPLFSGVGVLARNCIAEIEGLHVVVADGDILLHDGQSAKSIADSYIRETFLDTVDNVSIQRCFALAWTPPGEVWIAFPEPGATSCTKAAVWDKQRARWGVRDLSAIGAFHVAQGVVPLAVGAGLRWMDQTETWAQIQRRWNYSGPRQTRYSLLAAGGEQDVATSFALEPGLFALDQTDLTLGQFTRGRLQRQAHDFGRPDTVKTVTRVWVKAKGATGTKLSVQVAGTMAPGQQPTYGAAAIVTIGGRMDAPVFATGRYISVQVTDVSDTSTPPWKVSELLFDYRTKGGY